jgi:hypothetical protein
VQTILFDNFQIWEGRCIPEEEPFAGEITPITPEWPELRTNLNKPTTLTTSMYFEKAFVGGGCGEVHVTNIGAQVRFVQVVFEVHHAPTYTQTQHIRSAYVFLVPSQSVSTLSAATRLWMCTLLGPCARQQSRACTFLLRPRAMHSFQPLQTSRFRADMRSVRGGDQHPAELGHDAAQERRAVAQLARPCRV